MSQESVLEKSADGFLDFIDKLNAENAALKAEVASLRINQHTQAKMPSEGAFMEWASSKGFKCSQAASTYDWFARKLRA